MYESQPSINDRPNFHVVRWSSPCPSLDFDPDPAIDFWFLEVLSFGQGSNEVLCKTYLIKQLLTPLDSLVPNNMGKSRRAILENETSVARKVGGFSLTTKPNIFEILEDEGYVSPLLKLPRELRDVIYELILTGATISQHAQYCEQVDVLPTELAQPHRYGTIVFDGFRQPASEPRVP